MAQVLSDTIEFKYCSKCNSEKPLNEFYTYNKGKEELVYYCCKECQRKEQRNYYLRDTSRYHTQAKKEASKRYLEKVKHSEDHKKKNRERQIKFKERQKQLANTINIPLYECREIVREFDDKLDINSECFKAALVVLYGSVNGIHDHVQLAKATKVSSGWILSLKMNLESNGIWRDNTIFVESLFDENSPFIEWLVEFWLIVNVALGDIVRMEASDDPTWGLNKVA